MTDRLLGEGAGGAVYLAREPGHEDRPPVALKILKDPSPQGLELFEREIRHLSRLKHPGLVEVYGYSRTPTPRFWMEYVPGRNLLEAFHGASADARAAWFRECLEALRYLHSQGLLHGDLKPTNILIDGSGRARLLDFGCAGLTGEGVSALEGSFGYMAPELLEGQRYPASDLFALGTVFYEAFAGRIPRDAAGSLREFFSGRHRPLKELGTQAPERLARVIDKMIEPDRNARFKSAADVLTALEGGALLGTADREPEAEGIQTYRLFGREADWARAMSSLELAQNRRVLILVHGLSGVGATRFARELLWHLRLSGRKASAETASGVFQNLGRLYRFLREPGDDVWISDFADEALSPEAAIALRDVAVQAGVVDIRLQPLSAGESSEFLKTLLRRELPPELTRSFYERTGGNPRFLVELARDVASSGLLRKAHISSRDLEALAPPADLEGLLRRRAGRLDDVGKNLLGLLSVSSKPATENELTAMTGLSSEKLREALNDLVASGLIHAAGEGGLRAFRASHPSPETLLTALYASEERGALHERWIAFLEKRDDREAALPELASHALSLNHARAQEWVEAAGDVLSARKEDRKALDLYDAFLKQSGTKPPLILRKSINAAARLGDYRGMLARIEEFRGASPPDPLGVDEVKYWCFTAVGSKNLGDFEEASRRASVCLEKGKTSEPHHRPWMAKARLILGVVALAGNRLEEAEKNFSEAKALTEEGSEALAEILRHEASLHAQRRDALRVRQSLEQAGAVYRRLKADRGVFAVLTEAGNAALGLGDLAGAEASYGEALTIAARGENEDLLARAYQNLGVLSCRRGDYARAFDELAKARELFVYFGSGYERGLNRLQLALAFAMVGACDRARSLVGEARSMDDSGDFLKRLSEVEFHLEAVGRGGAPERCPPALEVFAHRDAPDWDLEGRWLREILREPIDPEKTRAVLEMIHHKLPDALKITFEERIDYRRYVGGEGSSVPTNAKETTAMDILAKLHALTRDLLRSEKLDEILVRIMDAAMMLSKAERGFLLLKSDNPESRLPEIGGYDVKIARNCSKEFLGGEDFRMSLTAVNEAVKTGQPLVTDNALLDKRLQTAESVRVNELKSLVVLPLNAGDEMVGALYLDHPYRTEIFQGTDLNILQMFADQAALTLQKARMMETLRKKNEELAERVETQVSEITFLKKTTEEQKLKLNREYAEIVGQSPVMLEVLSLVDRLVDSAIPVWIYGESGTGKEMVARALHFKGPRAKAPFVSENCSSLPETLLESELFGHKKGSFTHADRDKKGLLQHADGGTVFLDEIADMSAAMQSKMLRFLQEGEIRPIGSNQVVKVDVRVISASNKDLNVLIAEGKFREDLFYRLNGVTVPLPPLRDRMEDLPLLIKHFLKKTAEKEKKPPLELSGDALKLLMSYDWPGNVRELENTLRTANLFAQKGKITPQSFEFKKALFGESQMPAAKSSPKPQAKPATAMALKGKPVDAASAEKDLLLKTLHDTAYNKDLTAKTLGISRRYLYTLLERHGVPVQRLTMKAYIEAHLAR